MLLIMSILFVLFGYFAFSIAKRGIRKAQIKANAAMDALALRLKKL